MIDLLRPLARRLRRRLRGDDARIRAAYFASNSERKLHIGGGWRTLDGWLNSDLQDMPGILQMDATAPYPFEGGAFDYIYAEHMIEHVPLAGGLAMLRECRRVLRDGGVVRIVTPDLKRLLALYGDNPSPLEQRYMAFFHETFGHEGFPTTPVGVINAHFRLWGHQFLYDEETLAQTMAEAGFTDIRRYPVSVSDHPALAGLGHETRYPEGLLDFESVALEGRK